MIFLQLSAMEQPHHSPEKTAKIKEIILECTNKQEILCNVSAKHGHQRNLSLDFRSMGIVLPPISVALEPERCNTIFRNLSIP